MLSSMKTMNSILKNKYLLYLIGIAIENRGCIRALQWGGGVTNTDASYIWIWYQDVRLNCLH